MTLAYFNKTPFRQRKSVKFSDTAPLEFTLTATRQKIL